MPDRRRRGPDARPSRGPTWPANAARLPRSAVPAGDVHAVRPSSRDRCRASSEQVHSTSANGAPCSSATVAPCCTRLTDGGDGVEHHALALVELRAGDRREHVLRHLPRALLRADATAPERRLDHVLREHRDAEPPRRCRPRASTSRCRAARRPRRALGSSLGDRLDPLRAPRPARRTVACSSGSHARSRPSRNSKMTTVWYTSPP